MGVNLEIPGLWQPSDGILDPSLGQFSAWKNAKMANFEFRHVATLTTRGISNRDHVQPATEISTAGEKFFEFS